MQNTVLKRALFEARAQTDRLFSLVRPDSFYERPIPERHRIIFYLGHLETFDWNLICRGSLGMPAFHATFDRLFAFGIDPAVGSAEQDQPSDWPAVEETRSYGEQVRRRLDQALEAAPEQLLHVAVEHRLMHAETFVYILHNLPLDRKRFAHTEEPVPDAAPEPLMVEIPAGRATLGRDGADGFGWDNEFQALHLEVPSFAIDKYKVTNREYLEFVRQGAPAPHFWALRGRDWRLRTLFGEIPLPLDWPVYVTHAEAQAYAAWKGKALPSERQFHRAAYGTPNGEERSYPWGDTAPEPAYGNFDCFRWNPVPVTESPRGDSAFGVSQMVGNGWEWTSTVFGPLPGFQQFPFYPGYSADFFDGSHYVLKGGSARTASALLRRSFRNWFRPDYPHVYAGFRMVEQ
jgi:formylglycine-generating enzyme required for sulfatase activity